jgi:hypothetical protein
VRQGVGEEGSGEEGGEEGHGGLRGGWGEWFFLALGGVQGNGGLALTLRFVIILPSE